MTIDNELKELAALALRNAFWRAFSQLVNNYLTAAEGLDIDKQLMQMGEMTSVYGIDQKAEPDESLNIWFRRKNGSTCGAGSIMEALTEDPSAVEVHVEGQQVFKLVKGEWYWTGDDK